MRERLKTILILVLIFTGALQVGILWGYQSQGTPTGFLLGFFRKGTQISDKVTRETLFVPDRLILSNGRQDNRILKNNSKYFEELWNQARQGLHSIAAGELKLEASGEKWGDLIEKRGYIVDFGYSINPGLLKWFLGTDNKSGELPDIKKVMVRPDILNENMLTYYIYSSNGTVFVSESATSNSDILFSDVINYVFGKGNEEFNSYNTLRGARIDEAMGAEPDVLCVTDSPGYRKYREYNGKPPAKGADKVELADILLGSEKERYNTSTIDKDAVQFNYGDNVYKYYSNGYLTYNYLGSPDSSGSGNFGAALHNTYKFIDRVIKLQNESADIVLASAEEIRQGVFSFSFDYRLDGMAVFVDMERNDGSGGRLTNAINITADSKRVLKCEWLLRDFERGNEGYYNESFLDLAKNTGYSYTDMHIQDMRPGYYIGSTDYSLLTPALIIRMKDKSVLPIEMTRRERDKGD